MWVSWLRMNNDYLENIVSNEIIRNERQHKDFAVYHSLLSASFQKMFKVLKPNHYLTLTFHNPTFKVRNATIRAGVLIAASSIMIVATIFTIIFKIADAATRNPVVSLKYE